MAAKKKSTAKKQRPDFRPSKPLLRTWRVVSGEHYADVEASALYTSDGALVFMVEDAPIRILAPGAWNTVELMVVPEEPGDEP